jgi:hypothetical protein
MELREWQYINKPAGNSTTASTSSNTGNKSFKKRFDKIIKYYGDHLPAEVDYVIVNLLTNGSLNFTENYDNGDKVQYDIFIDDFDTEDWGIKIKVNGQPTEKYFDKGWAKLLNTLGAYIELPQMGDPEYKNLLIEWVVMNNKTSSSSGGYKKRFEKLIKYHIDHASSELERVNNKVINEYGFHLSEHYNTGSDEFNRTIIVSVNKYTDEFFLSIFVDGKEVYHNVYKSYEEVLEILTDTYMFLPDEGTPDYDDLLTESLNEWKLMNPPASSSAPSSTGSFESYKNRFNKLFDYATKHKHYSVVGTEIKKLSEDEHTSMFHFTHHVLGGAQGFDYDLEIILAINKPQGNWFLLVYEFDGKGHDKIADLTGSSYSSLLITLSDYIEVPAAGSSEYKDLLQESINASIADDFKLYENLWENI